VCALAPAPAAGGALPLPTRLADALAVRGNSTAASGAVAIDLATGKVLFARHPDLPLAPASNEKLTVTFAALRELGADYRFSTEVLATGAQTGAVWHGNVYLKGFGDPTLRGLELSRLAAQLEHLGIKRIDGRVLADESWFDSVRTAPGWKASFYVNECPPLSALVANGAVYEGHVALDPAVAAASLFRKLLHVHGIASGAVGSGRAPDSADSLAIVNSEPLRAIVADMDRNSDNFIAEMLLKDLGAQIGGAGTTAAGIAVVRADLASAGIPLTGVKLADGSGLSLLDRVTARAVATLLLDAWNDPVLRPLFWQALPVAGVSGTLEDRMGTSPARGNVRAKTGTTDLASALSGYAGTRYVFAVLQNGWPVEDTPARKAQDRFATALASAAEQLQ
jgi:D-alanyl-D-alanine carboxypeptidase/D-alanyl-D-alanine-endopeptidase (penicillin-binding protein 4)